MVLKRSSLLILFLWKLLDLCFTYYFSGQELKYKYLIFVIFISFLKTIIHLVPFFSICQWITT
ncbi:hypothetical protein C2G38_2077136 [Gigaspora rosea]|uniref:Uncharacterized protein n=1 Tax=Gigaspora rosea TaxID=44941 RepID=A0A397VJ79_9GLOM|nr:hypothetical protein C2G38_2077136 [Gigaspora rosea]